MIDKYRKEINEIDNQLMDLINQRMAVSKEIGRYKFANNLSVESKTREKEVLVKTLNFSYASEIHQVYQTILEESKKLQKYDYFLVGKTLKHSFSPIIYQELGLNSYNLLPIDDFSKIKNLNFKGMNITNPYKEDAYLLCNQLSDDAQATRVVNTIIKIGDFYLGFNTDYDGFAALIKYGKINPQDKKVIIIGNGASSRTVSKVLTDFGAKEIIYLVRSIRNANEYLISDYHKFQDYQIIINTTPYGTYPSDDFTPLFPLKDFKSLEVVFDIIYNPDITPLIREAKKYHHKGFNGLYMLISQAAKALSLYQDSDKTFLIDSVYHKLKRNLRNIVLIGMPFAGKTTLGNKLSLEMNRSLVDIDFELAKAELDLATVIKTKDITYYRQQEALYTKKFAKERGLIIATGGGIVLNDEAMEALKMNGIIVFLDVPLNKLKTRIDDTRPLVKDEGDLKCLYDERISLYRQYADVIIHDEEKIEKVMEKINESLSN